MRPLLCLLLLGCSAAVLALEAPVSLASYQVDPSAVQEYLIHEDPALATSQLAAKPSAAGLKVATQTVCLKDGQCEQKPYQIVGELVPHEPGMGLTLDKKGNVDTSGYDKLIKELKKHVKKNDSRVKALQHRVKHIAHRDHKLAASLKAKIAALNKLNKSLHAKLRKVEKTKGPKGHRGHRGKPGKRGRRGFTGPQGPQGKAGKAGKRGARGAPGAPGGPGVDGRNGANGARGPRGHRGRTGPKGAPGPSGARGPVGLPGKKGPHGPVGPRGPRGLTGRRGSPGPVGKPGLLGEKGLPGRRGPMGFRGKTGVSGKTGLVGHTGAKGLPGVEGPMGHRGLTGARGKRGAPGHLGPRGPPGHRGPKGFAGPTGPQGAVGPRGPTGFRGLHGRNGRDGKDGQPGRNGVPGKPGKPGKPGAKGPKGREGPRGHTGLPGARGPAGTPGHTGAPGLPGFRGPQGHRGPAGPRGPNGHNKTIKKFKIKVSHHNKKLLKKLRVNLKKLKKAAAKKAAKLATKSAKFAHVRKVHAVVFRHSKHTVALEGSVINYLNNRRIHHVKVTFKKNVKGKPGKTVKKVTANGMGHFGAMLKPGKYFVYVKKHGFAGAPVRIHLHHGVPRSRMVTGMSPKVKHGGARFVLTWGDKPSDLDSHLELPNGKCKVIYYHRKCDNWGDASLDLDATRGNGPETITINKAKKGTYEYTVQQFSNDGTLAKSEGKVLVFTGSKVKVFRAGKAAKGKKHNGKIEGKLWKVCKYVVDAAGKGKVVPY